LLQIALKHQKNRKLNQAEFIYRYIIGLEGLTKETRIAISRALNLLGCSYYNLNQVLKAESAYMLAISADPESSDAYTNLGALYLSQDKKTEAKKKFRAAQLLDPSNVSAKHIMNALNGKTTAKAPEEYVCRLFDQYSEFFDSHLIDNLKYIAPLNLRSVLTTFIQGEFHLKTLLT